MQSSRLLSLHSTTNIVTSVNALEVRKWSTLICHAQFKTGDIIIQNTCSQTKIQNIKNKKNTEYHNIAKNITKHMN